MDVEKKMDTPFEDSSSTSELSTTQEGVTAAYEAKSTLINEHLQNEIGFGRYQLQLFFLTGLGWAADNIWLQGVAIILPQIQNELHPTRVEFATMSLFIGLIVAVFGIAAGGANNFTTICALISCLGFGVGGNLPVDGAIFLEVLPKNQQWWLTLLSVWWALGQLFASLVAWPLISNFSCGDPTHCLKADNKGWRYTFYVLGGVTAVMWILRYVVFDLQESCKYLVAKGRDEEAIEVLEHIARKNGKTITLTLESLRAVAKDETGQTGTIIHLSTYQIVRNAFSSLSLSHVTPLFSTRRLAINTSITIANHMLCHSLIGLAYPLFNGFITLYLSTQIKNQTSSTYRTYRDYSIISVLGVPGSIIACLVVDYTRKNPNKFAMGGRKITMALSTALTGIFLFLFTTSKTEDAVLGYSLASGLTQIEYQSLSNSDIQVTSTRCTAFSTRIPPEVFPAPHRGTGDALCSAFNRICGVLAPVIKIVTTNPDGTAVGGTANGPIFVSATLFMVASVLMLFLPIETAGKAAL
ncbi:Sugar transporter [Mycena sanguinolenta]|uniref:Sugar transporter n=1 Tax=Mycena sanguinolenta TaxID=230812 RepID=A0A8H6X971_9AGAR|nr:Sugar transporter [Mycena sanguinolenta]